MKRPLLPAVAAALVLATPALGAGTYVNLGDSAARGVGAPSHDQSAGAIFYGYLRSPDLGGLDTWADTAGEDSYSNQTSESIRSGGQLAAGIAAIDGPSDTIVVTLTIGANDAALVPNCGRGRWNTDACAYRRNLIGILDDIQAALARDPGSEKLIVTLYYNPAAGQGGGAEQDYDTGLLGSDRRIDCNGVGDQQGLDDVIACTAMSHGAIPANAYTPSKRIGTPFVSSDGIHPSAVGHQALADAWRDAYVGKPLGQVVVPTDPAVLAGIVSALGLPADGSRVKVSRTGRVTIGRPTSCPPACGIFTVVGRAGGRTVFRAEASASPGGRVVLRARLSRRARGTLERRGRLSVAFRFTGTTVGDKPAQFDFTRRFVLRR